MSRSSKSPSKFTCFLGLCLALNFLSSALIAAETVPLPRIIVSEDAGKAVFRNSGSGEVFQAIGSSYLPRMHKTFSPGSYDPEHAEAALEKMAEGGFTTVRIWAYHGHFRHRRDGSFAMEGPDFRNQRTPELSQPYVDNLVDFILRANRNKIYVHLVIDREPDTPFYRGMVNSGYPDVEGFHHREYLTSGSIEAKEIYIAELIKNFKARDSNLLTTLFAYEIRNEVHASTAHAPFNRTEGMVETAAGRYNMGDPASRLACFGITFAYFCPVPPKH